MNVGEQICIWRELSNIISTATEAMMDVAIKDKERISARLRWMSGYIEEVRDHIGETDRTSGGKPNV